MQCPLGLYKESRARAGGGGGGVGMELKATQLDEVFQEVHSHTVRRTQMPQWLKEEQQRTELELSEEETRSEALRSDEAGVS